MSNNIQIFLDSEATGLNYWCEQITQIAAIAYHEDQEISHFVTLVKAEREISAKAAEITGITKEKLKNAPSTKDALKDFIRWMLQLVAKKEKEENKEYTLSWVAHNGFDFDYPLIFSEFWRYDIRPNVIVQKCKINYLVDSLLYARKFLPKDRLLLNRYGKPSYKLCDLYGVCTLEKLNNAHDALVDTRALMKICCSELFRGICYGEPVGDKYCQNSVKYVKEFIRRRTNKDVVARVNLKRKHQAVPTVSSFMDLNDNTEDEIKKTKTC